MTGKIKRFFVRLLLFTVVLILLTFLLGRILPEGSLPAVLSYLFILFFIITLAIHWVVLKISELKPTKFVSYFMLATFAKLIIYFIAVLVYVFTRKEQVLNFIITFFILYILYTVFEVVNILNQTNASDKKTNNYK